MRTCIIIQLLKPLHMDDIRRSLRNICDLEKLNRQLVLKKLYPQSIYTLYQSLSTIDELTTTVGKNAKIADYLLYNIDDQNEHAISSSVRTIKSFQESVRTCTHFIETTLDIEKCRGLTSVLQFEENIIKKGISTTLDKVQQEYSENLALFYKTQKFFNDLCLCNNANAHTKETEYVKVHETDKLGLSLQITHKRGEHLQSEIKKCQLHQTTANFTIADNFIIPAKDVRLKKSSATVDEIDFPQLVRLQDTIRKLKDQINDEIASAYLEFLSLLETRHYDDIDHFAKFIAKLDLLQCKAYIAKKFNYCKPYLVKKDDYTKGNESFFSAKDLRHVLIEHIQTSEIYVTNNIELSDQNGQGLLIYGTNAVGKTSFIRSIGICIILAQAGFYVPCSTFQYKPYTAIYSRILGNDNLFKGLSTFAVEMSELRVILKHADEKSLILGDELCSGTEMESALSIFAAGLVTLNEKRSTFLFATHFHDIVNYDEIDRLVKQNTLQIKHMAVKYDREKDILLYERKLADGPGNRMYGLEVCKSLHLSADFLEKAFELRGKYFGGKSELTHPVSKYNARKIRGLCEKCGEKMGEETHHLAQQKEANADGFIGSFHKNHPANLASVCEDCHREFHHKPK